MRLARFMLDRARDEPSLISRRPSRATADPYGLEAMNRAGLYRGGAQARRLDIDPLPCAPWDRVSPGPDHARYRQRIPVARYAAPAVCMAGLMVGLIALLPSGPPPAQTIPADPTRPAAALPADQALLAELRTTIARQADEVARLMAERDGIRASAAAMSVAAADGGEPVPPPPPPRPAPVREIGPAPSPKPSSANAGRRDVAVVGKDRPRIAEPVQAVAGVPDISRQLSRARAALLSGDRNGARTMIKEAQTLLVFKPSSALPAQASAAASQISHALMMLSDQDDELAVRYLNQALAAVRPQS